MFEIISEVVESFFSAGIVYIREKGYSNIESKYIYLYAFKLI